MGEVINIKNILPLAKKKVRRVTLPCSPSFTLVNTLKLYSDVDIEVRTLSLFLYTVTWPTPKRRCRRNQ